MSFGQPPLMNVQKREAYIAVQINCLKSARYRLKPTKLCTVLFNMNGPFFMLLKVVRNC